jgi:hypothetical protein
MNGDGGQPMSAAKLSEYSGAPSKRTLQYWKRNTENPMEVKPPKNPRGRPSKLTDDQLKIIGGFVLFCVEPHQGCTVMDIQNFSQTLFHQTLSEPFTSQHMHTLASHRPPHSRSLMVASILQKLQWISFVQINQCLESSKTRVESWH